MKWLVEYFSPLNIALDARHCDERLAMGGRQFRLAAAAGKKFPNFTNSLALGSDIYKSQHHLS
jgi:hypothetical protein